MKTTKNLYIIIKREFRRIAERKTLYLLSIFIPVTLFLLFGLIYQKEIIREVPIVIFDNDNSSLSRTAIQMIESSTSLKIVDYVNSIEDIENRIIKGEIHGAFYIPNNFEKNIKQGKNSDIVVFKNTANLVIGNIIYKDANTIVKTLSAGVVLKKLKSKGMMHDQAMNLIMPIRIETKTLYNPNYSYKSYLAPGLMAFTLQMLIMLSSVLIISSEFTHETFPTLLRLANKRISLILIGKIIPHFLIHSANALLIVGIFFPLFNIRVYGSLFLVLIFLLYFIITCISLGVLISSLFHDQLFATELALFINTPGFIFSGFTFPLWGMPMVHSIFAQIMPFTHFLNGFLKLYQMNAPLSYILPELKILSIFTIGSLILSVFAIKFQIKKYYKNI